MIAKAWASSHVHDVSHDMLQKRESEQKYSLSFLPAGTRVVDSTSTSSYM